MKGIIPLLLLACVVTLSASSVSADKTDDEAKELQESMDRATDNLQRGFDRIQEKAEHRKNRDNFYTAFLTLGGCIVLAAIIIVERSKKKP